MPAYSRPYATRTTKAAARSDSFEHAAARGEELATRARVRLFYFESQQEPPFLLKDARRH